MPIYSDRYSGQRTRPRMKRFWADNTCADFATLDRERAIAVLPIGAIEQHGPHLPVKVDACTVDGIARRLVRSLPADSPVLVLPTQSVCTSTEHIDYPGTLTLTPETFIRVLAETGASVARSGVRKLVLLNGHGGNVPSMDIAARKLRVEQDMLVFSLSWFALGLPEGLFSETERSHGIHAGDMETSVMLALDPDNVAIHAAHDFHSRGQDLTEKFRHIGLARAAKPAWKTQDLNTAGACGEAHLATSEKGETTLAHAVKRLCEALDEIDAIPLNWLDRSPED